MGFKKSLNVVNQQLILFIHLKLYKVKKNVYVHYVKYYLKNIPHLDAYSLAPYYKKMMCNYKDHHPHIRNLT